MILSDYHVHTNFSTDSDTPMETMAVEALQRQLTSLCFTDHMDYDFPKIEGKDAQFVFSPDSYFQEMNRVALCFPSLRILKGIELGLKPDIADKCNNLVSAFPFDFVIGSTHLVDNQDPYHKEYWTDKTQKQAIVHYYETTLENIAAGIDYDVYGHIDYIIRYAPMQKEYRRKGIIHEEYMQQCLKDSLEIIDEILRQLIPMGKGIELNTAGLKYGLGHPNPHETILRRYRELGGEIITVGSDGHQPEHLAYCFDQVPEILSRCGFSYYTEFQDRKPVMIKL